MAAVQCGHTHRVSNDVVVPLPCAVDANDAKGHKDHGPRVHQRPHCWLPAACVYAGVEAEGGGEAGLGCCRGGTAVQKARPSLPEPTAASCIYLSRWARRRSLWSAHRGLELSKPPGGATHTPMEGLVGLGKIQLPVEAKEAGTEARRARRARRARKGWGGEAKACRAGRATQGSNQHL